MAFKEKTGRKNIKEVDFSFLIPKGYRLRKVRVGAKTKKLILEKVKY